MHIKNKIKYNECMKHTFSEVCNQKFNNFIKTTDNWYLHS